MPKCAAKRSAPACDREPTAVTACPVSSRSLTNRSAIQPVARIPQRILSVIVGFTSGYRGPAISDAGPDRPLPGQMTGGTRAAMRSIAGRASMPALSAALPPCREGDQRLLVGCGIEPEDRAAGHHSLDNELLEQGHLGRFRRDLLGKMGR